MPRKEAAARIGCADQTLKGWLSWHRMQLAPPSATLNYWPTRKEQWKRFTPHEQLMWVRDIYERGLDLNDFPLMPTLKRQSFGTSDPWFHAEWAILLMNFGGKTKAEMARRLGVHPSTLSKWMKEGTEYGRLLKSPLIGAYPETLP